MSSDDEARVRDACARLTKYRDLKAAFEKLGDVQLTDDVNQKIINDTNSFCVAAALMIFEYASYVMDEETTLQLYWNQPSERRSDIVPYLQCVYKLWADDGDLYRHAASIATKLLRASKDDATLDVVARIWTRSLPSSQQAAFWQHLDVEDSAIEKLRNALMRLPVTTATERALKTLGQDKRDVVVVYGDKYGTTVWQYNASAHSMLAILPTKAHKALWQQQTPPCDIVASVAGDVVCTATLECSGTRLVLNVCGTHDVKTRVLAAHNLLQVVLKGITFQEEVRLFCEDVKTRARLSNDPAVVVDKDGRTIVRRVHAPPVIDPSMPVFVLVCTHGMVLKAWYRLGGQGAAVEKAIPSDLNPALLQLQVQTDPNGYLCDHAPATLDARRHLPVVPDDLGKYNYLFLLLDGTHSVVGHCFTRSISPEWEKIRLLCVGAPSGIVSPLQNGRAFLTWVLDYFKNMGKQFVTLKYVSEAKPFYASQGFFIYSDKMLAYVITPAPPLVLPVGFVVVSANLSTVRMYVCASAASLPQPVLPNAHVRDTLQTLVDKSNRKFRRDVEILDGYAEATHWVIMVSKQCNILGLAALQPPAAHRKYIVATSTNATGGRMVKTMLVPFVKWYLAHVHAQRAPPTKKRARD